ncbi:MAG: response regulator transcription factor [Chloroflexi bacterium]|nr:MAG: response regulator transcription factor [Chloroflexota bacterium]
MSHPSGKGLAKKTLLVVEENPTRGALLLQILSEQAAYQVILVATGLQALRLMKGDSKLRPDLVLLNDHLPDMHGLECYDWLSGRAELNDISPMFVPFTAAQGFFWLTACGAGHQPRAAQESREWYLTETACRDQQCCVLPTLLRVLHLVDQNSA